jgi:hypothetical protein
VPLLGFPRTFDVSHFFTSHQISAGLIFAVLSRPPKPHEAISMFRTTGLTASLLVLGLANPARADTITYGATLSGSAESPPNASPGTGTALVQIDPLAHTMRVQVFFSGLSAPSFASHIHAATAFPGTGNAGVATQTPSFNGFPQGTSGSYDNTFDMTLSSSFNPMFVTSHGGTAASAEAALFAALAADEAYLNIHTANFPGGEIRGFLTPVPAPPAVVLVGLGAGCVTVRRLVSRRAAV